eukprot:COSAG02_NODE_22027_length_766_cov_1.047976_2_plen_157_part_01
MDVNMAAQLSAAERTLRAALGVSEASAADATRAAQAATVTAGELARLNDELRRVEADLLREDRRRDAARAEVARHSATERDAAAAARQQREVLEQEFASRRAEEVRKVQMLAEQDIRAAEAAAELDRQAAAKAKAAAASYVDAEPPGAIQGGAQLLE